MKKTVFAALALMAAPLALSACGSDAAQEEQTPEGVGLVIENARLVMPPVSGNPAAIYFDMTNSTDRKIGYSAVSVDKAESATLHKKFSYDGQPAEMAELGPQVIKSGETVNFKPGDMHVMVMNLDESVKAGDSVEVTLTVAGGDKQSFAAEVVAPGEGMLEEE